MKKITLPLTLGLAALLCVTFFVGVSTAQTPPMTDAQISRIKASCVGAKNTLDQLHASDALLRVNRGQLYESMTTKLMSRFNTRATSNGSNIDTLETISQNYGTTLTSFRTDYQAYEQQLSAALKIDCLKEPVSFYDAVRSSRTKRAQVHADVLKLHTYITDYQKSLTAFQKEFKKTGESQ